MPSAAFPEANSRSRVNRGDAGMLVSARHGRSVLYHRSDLGDQLAGR